MKYHVTITITLLILTAIALIGLLFIPRLGASAGAGNEAFLPVIVNMPTQTPTPTLTPTITVTPTLTPSVTITPTLIPSVTVTSTLTPSVTVTPTLTPSVTATPTLTPSVTVTPTLTPSATAIPTLTPTAVATPPPGNALTNGSFELGWTDMPPAPGNLINQQPNGWFLSWVPIGGRLWDLDAISYGVPEALHKLSSQLPAHEQLGQPNALILDGAAVYKIFHFGSSFGGSLQQTVTGLIPGSSYQLTAPVLMVQHNTSEQYSGAAGLFVNGQGTWVWDITMGDRNWHTLTVDLIVPEDGTVNLELRVLSKWTKKDFFIDDIQLKPN